MGLGSAGFLRSVWVVGAALLAAGAVVILADRLHTLPLLDCPAGVGRCGAMPEGTIPFLDRYWAYAIWALAQQFLLQDFFLWRLLRVFKSANSAVGVAAVVFAAAHLPNPILTGLTLMWGLASCKLFLRYRNLYSLAVAHAILGITIAVAVPGPVTHNMRAGLGYLTYKPMPAPSTQP